MGMAKTSGKDNDYSNMAFCGHYLLSQAYQDDTIPIFFDPENGPIYRMNQIADSLKLFSYDPGLPVAGGWVFRL